MTDGAPGLEVGFSIDPGSSFTELDRLRAIMNSTEANVLKAAANVERSTGSMINLGGATAQVTSFGNAHTREMQTVTRENAKVEKSGEAMVRQMIRQAETFGKTGSEIRSMRAELRAVDADGRGMTELAGRIRAAAAEMERLEMSTGRVGSRAKLSRADMLNLGYQINDVVVSLASGQKPMMVFAQQGAQIGQIAASSGVGLRGMAAGVAALALPFLPVIALIGAATAGLGLFVRNVNQGVTNDQLTNDLGKITGGADATKQELYKLRDETVTWGDTTKAIFSVVGKDVAEGFVGDIGWMSNQVKAVLNDLTSYGRMALAGIYAGAVGTKSYIGELSKPKGIYNLVTGDPTLLDRTYGEAYRKADKYLTDLGARVKKAAVQNARVRIAESIGYNAPDSPKVDRTAERLARENAAIEAQIRNLYALADAYGVSGAAALIAEARVKAESDAIKKRGDIEMFVDRQVRLAIAERVKSAGQSSFALREQADVQAGVNTMVAQGLIPAERAAELVRERIAELPLLAAIEAAYQRGRVTDAQKAEKELATLRGAQADVRAASIGNRATQDTAAAERQLAILGEELRLIGASEDVRVRSLATIRATQQATAELYVAGTSYFSDRVAQLVEIAVQTDRVAVSTREWNDELMWSADRWDLIAQNVADAGRGMADAFGDAGRALGDLVSIGADYIAQQERLAAEHRKARQEAVSQGAIERADAKFAIRSHTAQIGLFGDMTSAAKGFVKERSKGYKALEAAEKVFRAFEFAMSVRAMVQDVTETITSIANSGARAAAAGAEGVANQSKLPFPANIAAMAATAAALIAAGITIIGGGGGANTLPKSNIGTGTILGDSEAQSESIKRSIDNLKDIDVLMLSASRDMAASLRSIDTQIGGVAALVVRAGNIDANAGVTEGFKANTVGSILGAIPLVGGLLKSLFGSTTTVVGSGLSAGPQSLGSILGSGFDASYYSDIEKKKKLFGITTGKSYSTQYTGADAGLEGQFTLILREFNKAIAAAAGPLGESTDAIQQRLSGFIVNIGKIDTKGLTGAEIEEKLSAVFGAAADGMAAAAIPGIERFQKVGEGAFETLVRVASTVESVTASLDQMGVAARSLSIEAKLGIAGQFESIRDFTSAADAYFDRYYTAAEKNAATLARFGQVFMSMGVTLPETLAGFRALVDAQDLTTTAGQATYATLLQLAPAFADLQESMNGAKSAADILSERADLERKLLELAGDTAALRALDLAKLDASNRVLQEQVWAVQDAQEAARAADDLRKAWTSVGASLRDEIERIRGLNGIQIGGGFATLQGRFNATTALARGGDQDAAKLLTGMSQELLRAASDAVRSRQELERVQALTAASLEETLAAIGTMTGATAAGSSTQALLDAMSVSQSATAVRAANNDLAAEVRSLRAAVDQMRADNNAGLAAVASNTGSMKRTLDNVTSASGGDAIQTVQAAA